MSTSGTWMRVGIDAGKGPQQAVAIIHGEAVFSPEVVNAEAEILQLIAVGYEAGDEMRWVAEISGRTINRMSGDCRGERMSDAEDAQVVADQGRTHWDFTPLSIPPKRLSTLQVPTNYLADLIANPLRLINRLRDLLVGICPTLGRAFDCSSTKDPVIMLTKYQTPILLRIGVKWLATCLERRKVRSAGDVAAKATGATQSQHIGLPGAKWVTKLVCERAYQLLAFDEGIKGNDREIR